MYTGIVELDLVTDRYTKGWNWASWCETMERAIEQPDAWLFHMAYINF